MSVIDERLAQVRHEVRELDARTARALFADGARVIDIREASELEGGTIPGAQCVPRGFLEFRISRLCPDRSAAVLITCASGARSLLAAASLQQMGYHNVASLKGGVDGWQAAGFALVKAEILNQSEERRYSRHLRIPEVGTEGQLKLKRSKVLLIGCGGLGSPAALYLTAAGVGRLTLLDFDVVDETNLQRQILFREQDVGKPKAPSAAAALRQLNSTIDVVAMTARADTGNLDELVRAHDVVVDGTDNFSARFAINDACVRASKPLVHGSIYRFDGQVSVFRNQDPNDACYRCLYPEAPPPELAPSCMEAGVLGVLPGVVGTLQAVECLKLLLGLGVPLSGKLLTYDALQASFFALDIEKSAQCCCHSMQGSQRQSVLQESCTAGVAS